LLLVQGLFVLTAMRRLADRGLQHMEDVVGQEGIVDKMQVCQTVVYLTQSFVRYPRVTADRSANM
jgi:hypothetical protein